MTGRKPNNLPMTTTELAVSMQDDKRSKLYRTETMAANDARITELIENVRDGMRNVADPAQKVSLSDTSRVQQITLDYLQACSNLSTLPTMSGLAKALGMTRAALYDHMRRHPHSETTAWLEDFSDTAGEVMMQAALSGSVQQIPAIFIAKARHGYKDVLTVETPSAMRELSDVDTEAIAAKYAELTDD